MQDIRDMGDGGGHSIRFTLIEMIVVLAIIAVLAAMLMPVLAGVRGRGRSTACRSNLRQVGLAHTAYQDDHYGNVLQHLDKGNYGSWINYLHVDMGFPENIFRCPAASVHFRPYSGENAATDYKNLGIRASYLMNIIRDREAGNAFGDWEVYGWQDGVNAARVAHPANTIFITEIADTFAKFGKEMHRTNAAKGVKYIGYPDGWEYTGDEESKDNWMGGRDGWIRDCNTDLGKPIEGNFFYNPPRRQVGDHHHGGFNALMGDGSVHHMPRSSPSMWIAYEQQ